MQVWGVSCTSVDTVFLVQVALGSLWAAHLVAHLAWAKLVTSVGASVATVSAGIAVATSSAFAAFWIFRVCAPTIALLGYVISALKRDASSSGGAACLAVRAPSRRMSSSWGMDKSYILRDAA